MITRTPSGWFVACDRCKGRAQGVSSAEVVAHNYLVGLGWFEMARRGRKPDWLCPACKPSGEPPTSFGMTTPEGGGGMGA